MPRISKFEQSPNQFGHLKRTVSIRTPHKKEATPRGEKITNRANAANHASGGQSGKRIEIHSEKAARAAEAAGNRGRTDFGYGCDRGAEREDREHRAAYPWMKMQSAYRSIVGKVPKLKPRDFAGASEFLKRVENALAQGGWTRGEWARLYQLRKVWELRVAGRDQRFNLVGNHQGGLTNEQREHIKLMTSFDKIREMQDGEGE